MKSVSELSLYESKRKKSIGYIYTLYKITDQTVKIGFTKYIDIFRINIENQGYTLIEERLGSEREVNIIRDTLKELGFKPIDSFNIYKYSPILFRHLDILGWPVKVI